MRGNPALIAWVGRVVGSIPAHAGEPRLMEKGGCVLRVYPRACGGTISTAQLAGDTPGLSPRMRGNHLRVADSDWPGGSIPAHAGEPVSADTRRDRGGVYPRACGGTRCASAAGFPEHGLSPRMRGNPSAACMPPAPHGSIPAHAGEPAAAEAPQPPIWVYPRACGGTQVAEDIRKSRTGLSPRMRGNRRFQACRIWVIGSIPAHAGEPRTRRSRPGPRRVYPRACGGTAIWSFPVVNGQGLSPRMRGNPIICDVM